MASKVPTSRVLAAAPGGRLNNKYYGSRAS